MPSTLTNREVELKFFVPATQFKGLVTFISSVRKKGRVRLVETSKAVQHDVYFDSQAFDLVRHYCSLRVRRKEKEQDSQRAQLRCGAAASSFLSLAFCFAWRRNLTVLQACRLCLQLRQPARELKARLAFLHLV